MYIPCLFRKKEVGIEFWFNPLPNNKILDMTKLKAFANNKLNFAKMVISLFHRVENTGGKGKNAFQKCFPKSSLRSLKVGIV